MKRDRQAHHLHRQHVYDLALAAQGIVVLDAQLREDLSWNLADATAAQPTWEAVRASLVAELTHRGLADEVGAEAVRTLAEALLRAAQDDPEPPAISRAASSSGWLARRRRARAARRGGWFTPQPWGEHVEADRAVVRALLQVLRPWAVQVQCDLPLAARAQWPPAVTSAADHLLEVSPRQRGDDETYATTGWLDADDESTWQAFVTFAPYSLGCDVLSARASGFVEINDEGTSVALHLDAEQQVLVLSALDGRHLAPLP